MISLEKKLNCSGLKFINISIVVGWHVCEGNGRILTIDTVIFSLSELSSD